MANRPVLPHPNSEAVGAVVLQGKKAFVFVREWFQALAVMARATPVTGTVTFSAATTAAVTLAVPETDTSYSIMYDAPEDRRVWTTSKTVSGFTANVSASSSATYGWTLVRR
jgi:hypothetical protein